MERAVDDSEMNWNVAWIEWNRRRHICRKQVTSARFLGWKLKTAGLVVITTVVTVVATTLAALKWGGIVTNHQPPDTSATQRVGNDWESFYDMDIVKMIEREITIAKTKIESESLRSIPEVHYSLRSEKNSNSNATDVHVLTGWTNGYKFLSADGSYQIPSTGYYLIYTSLSFTAQFAVSSGSTSVETIRTLFWQELWRIQGGIFKELLLNDVQSERCVLDSENPSSICYRSNILAVLRMATGDRLYIRVSHPDMVDRVGASSFFGAVKIS